MSTSFNRSAVAALALAGALALAACTGGPDGTADGETPEGPLDKYFSALWDGEEYTQERFDQEQAQIEELVAECMTKEGFEYQPNTQNGGVIMSSDDQEGPEWGSKEFAEQYGLGIVEWPGMTDFPEPGDDDYEEYVDPNGDYVNSLSPSEQEAFYETLYGQQPTEEEIEMMNSDEGYVWEPEDTGCYGTAQEEIYAEQNAAMALYEDPEFADLMSSMEGMYMSMQESSEMRDLDAEWSSCMADTGLGDFATRDDLHTKLYEEWDAVQMPDGPEGEWVEPTQQQKDEFQAREVEVAVADFECNEQVDYEKRSLDIMFELQQEFVDQHKDQLDAMVAKYGQDKK